MAMTVRIIHKWYETQWQLNWHVFLLLWTQTCAVYFTWKCALNYETYGSFKSTYISNKYKYVVKRRYAWISIQNVYYHDILRVRVRVRAYACVYMWTLSTWILFNCWLVTKGKPSEQKKTGSNLGICIYEMDLLKSHRISIQLGNI